MNVRLFGCKKFIRLSNEQADRSLSVPEERFLDKHRRVCSECRKAEVSASYALNMLRLATLEPEVAPMFEDRVLRRLKVQQVKESLNYWSPALLGAGLACAVIFVTLHLATEPGQAQRAKLPLAQSKNSAPSRISPRLELNHPPILR
ncbi:MAG: hypothetical protein P4L46_12475 [Fimbriimonas sp.]|nr:hypothetical protein [Fimbriimonas sp.]